MNRVTIFLLLSVGLLLGGCASGPFQHESASHGALKDDASVEVTILRAKEMEKKGDWSGATVLYRAAVERNPKDKALNRAFKRFKKRRERHLLRLEVDMLIAKANWTKKQDTYRRASDSGYNDAGKRQLEIISKALAKKGLRALELRRISLAKKALRRAVKMHANPITKKAHSKLVKRLKTAKRHKRSRHPAKARDDSQTKLAAK